MRNLENILKTSVILICSVFISCNKNKMDEQVTLKAIPNGCKDIILFIREENNKLKQENSILKQNEEDDKKCFWKIVKEDIKGALEGAAAGGTAGATTGVGAVPGAIAGGVILGTAASVEAAANCNNESKRTVPSPTINVKVNDINMFEHVGFLHNTAVMNIKSNQKIYFQEVNNKNVLVYDKLVELLRTIDDKNNITLLSDTTYLNYFYPYFLNLDDNNSSVISTVQKLYNQNKLSTVEYSILKEYALTIDNMIFKRSLAEFQNFSFELENNIIRASDLSAKSKAILLSAITIGKYSFAMNYYLFFN